MQLKLEEELAGKGKRKAEREDEDSSRSGKRTIGEGDVDSRLDKKKLDDVLSGKDVAFGGKPVTEEEMGKFLLSFFSFSINRN